MEKNKIYINQIQYLQLITIFLFIIFIQIITKKKKIHSSLTSSLIKSVTLIKKLFL